MILRAGTKLLWRLSPGRTLTAAAALCLAGTIAFSVPGLSHRATPRGSGVASAAAGGVDWTPADPENQDVGVGMPPPGDPAAALAGASGPHVTVPILLYHYIRVPQPTDHLGINLSVTPAVFAEQMALLAAEGAHPVTLAQLVRAMTGVGRLPSRPVVLSFDDGYADFATQAEPVLARYGFTAIDFVVSGFIDRPGYMSSAQVRHMETIGMVVGTHTMHHVNLAKVPTSVAWNEIAGGKAALERLLGHPVLDFAYPYGGVTAQVAAMTAMAGFRDASTTAYGSTEALTLRYFLPRIHMGGATQTLDSFARAAGIPRPTAQMVMALTTPTPGSPAVARGPALRHLQPRNSAR